MKLIVGLGNAERRYDATRHNLGFRAIDAVRSHLGATGHRTTLGMDTTECRVGRTVIVLAKPVSLMNISGEPIRRYARYRRIAPADLLIVYDDLDLPLGSVRYRERGSAGGHRGMASVIESFGTEAIPRLRIGIGSNRARGIPAEAYVLQRFTPTERTAIDACLPAVVEAIDTFISPSARTRG